MICDQEPEPRRVEISTRSKNPIHRKTRELPSDVGQDIDRVRDDEQDRIGRRLSERRDDVAEESDVPLEQIEPRLSRVLPSAGGDDAEIGSGGDTVINEAVILVRGRKAAACWRSSISPQSLSGITPS